MTCRATTADGRDKRRKVILSLHFKLWTGSTKDVYPLPTSRAVRFFLRRRLRISPCGMLVRELDMMWHLTVITGVTLTTALSPRGYKYWRRNYQYTPCEEMPIVSNYKLASLWVRMNFDWLMLDRILPEQMARLGLIL